MSYEARNWASQSSELTAKEKAVLMCLADFHNQEFGYAWPSISRIARDTCFSESSVKRAIRGLRERGLIVTARQMHKYLEVPTTNRYYLVGHSPQIPAPNQTFISAATWSPNGRWEEDPFDPGKSSR
jgi:hypothetical protein